MLDKLLYQYLCSLLGGGGREETMEGEGGDMEGKNGGVLSSSAVMAMKATF